MQSLDDQTLNLIASLSPDQIEEFERNIDAEIRRKTLIEDGRNGQRFSDFVQLAWPIVDPSPYVHGWHIEAVCDHLEALTFGKIDGSKILINIPPGSSKSMIVCVLWMAWVWGPANLPHKRFMFTSYDGELAREQADKFRTLIKSEWYQDRWGDNFSLMRDSRAFVSNNKNGSRISVAINSIMGRGGDFNVLDDPHNVMQAESDDVRQGKVRMISLALPTRERDHIGGGTVVIMQRLHEGDYAGEMLASDEDFDHLCMPMEYEVDHPHPIRSSLGFKDPRTVDGELLYPERMNKPKVDRLKIALGEYGYAGQGQQRPAPREGGLCKRADFQMLNEPWEGGTMVRAWDFAGSERKQSPYTVGVLMQAVTDRQRVEAITALLRNAGILVPAQPDNQLQQQFIIIRDVVRERIDSTKVDTLVVKTAAKDGKRVKIDFPQDPGEAGKRVASYRAGLLMGFTVTYSVESGSKIDRFEPFASQVGAHNVYMITAPWNGVYLNEVCIFPGSKYKDQADATSRGFHFLINNGHIRIDTVRGLTR